MRFAGLPKVLWNLWKGRIQVLGLLASVLLACQSQVSPGPGERNPGDWGDTDKVPVVENLSGLDLPADARIRNVLSEPGRLFFAFATDLDAQAAREDCVRMLSAGGYRQVAPWSEHDLPDYDPASLAEFSAGEKNVRATIFNGEVTRVVIEIFSGPALNLLPPTFAPSPDRPSN